MRRQMVDLGLLKEITKTHQNDMHHLHLTAVRELHLSTLRFFEGHIN